MSITITQAVRELEFRSEPKASRKRDPEFAYGEAFSAGGDELRAIAAKSTRKAPAKVAPAKPAKAPKAKAAPKNPEANAAFQKALADGRGLKTAFRDYKRIVQIVATQELAAAVEAARR